MGTDGGRYCIYSKKTGCALFADIRIHDIVFCNAVSLLDTSFGVPFFWKGSLAANM